MQGAGLFITYTNVEKIEVDGLGGNDNFFVLSTAPGVVTVLDGGTGSDTFNVGGDVTGQVVALNPDGTSAAINHSVSSSDPMFNGDLRGRRAGDGRQLLDRTGRRSASRPPACRWSRAPARRLASPAAARHRRCPPTRPATRSRSAPRKPSRRDDLVLTVAAAPASLATGGTGLLVSADNGATLAARAGADLRFVGWPTASPTPGRPCARSSSRLSTGAVQSDSTIEVMHSIYSTTADSPARSPASTRSRSPTSTST